MANRNYITVEELNFYINNVFLSEELLHNVPVVGEVSGCSVVGGHCYFTLKDEKAQIKVVVFNCQDKYVPVNGEKVLVVGSVDYFAKGGTVNVKAYCITHFGVGDLEQKFQELKEKLEKEGLFRDEYKKSIPNVLRRVAVITSLKGAAVQDFLTTVRSRNEVVDLDIIDVRVQGESCVSDIVTALNCADTEGYDLIIIARGGGSYEDLFCYNDERLVRTIFDMDTPVMSAVGHETDYTLCDFVSDYRAITPTAAGEYVANSYIKQRNALLSYIKELRNIANEILDNEKEYLIDNCEKLQDIVQLIVQKNNYELKNILQKMNFLQNARISAESSKISNLCSILEEINPLKLLKKGYFRILSRGVEIYKTEKLKENDTIKIIGIDGEKNAIIIDGGSDGLRE